ncbi:MAG: double-strand break repair helicase AddA [Rhodomicrobium sp.]
MSEMPLSQALLLQNAERKQNEAADPSVSAWVRANAGSGKTHVLVRRLLRLLLSGAEPRSILCLTFTKNAAAEMEARVLAALGEWAVSTEEELRDCLRKLLGRTPVRAEMELARCLFPTVIDVPGGLGIMTIHSFCERLLRRFSIEANVPPGFTVLTEEEARDTLQQSMAAALENASGGPFREAFDCIASHASDIEFSRVLEEMLCRRSALTKLFQTTPAEAPLEVIRTRLHRVFGLSPADTKDGLARQAVNVLNAATLKEILAALKDGSEADQKCRRRFEAVLAATGTEAKLPALKEAFATKACEPRRYLMTAAVKNRHEGLHNRLVAAQELFLELERKFQSAKVVEASTALLSLTEAIFEKYEGAERTRGALDFDDLIGKALSLLSRHNAAAWVLYELDSRIGHILVDEAQDTSPEQWQIIAKLTEDFFAGESARAGVPTLFAVGDEKQSIYGFQGAAPEFLEYYGGFYEAKVRQARLPWRAVSLDLSFRSLTTILTAVDEVSCAVPGLDSAERIRHLAYRQDGAGMVELWEPEAAENEDKGNFLDAGPSVAPSASPAQLLAKRIAGKVKHWLDRKGGLSCGHPTHPGDILILLRKREPMAKLIQAALRREGVPVAGSDRMALADELCVMDLLALADCLLQTEDDLSLAAVLKSPLIGLSEDDVFALAYGRETSLWQALATSPKWALAWKKLSEWRDLAFTLSPFEFYARIIEAERGRDAFARRLGPGCFEALDEFLALAEAFSARLPTSLAGFVSFVRKSATEIRRDTDQAAREVRIMTVHGAKGLEANIVILADTCSNKSASAAPIYFLDDGSGGSPLPVWAVKGTGSLPPIAEGKEVLKASEQRELGRLLYVAMTRARDYLYVTGFHSGRLPEGCWYDTIKTALASSLVEAKDAEDRTVWRLGAPGAGTIPGLTEEKTDEPLPAWIAKAPRKEASVTILSPSKLAEQTSFKAGTLPHVRNMDRKAAQAYGSLVHKLFEVLPAIPKPDRLRAARLIGSTFAASLPVPEIEGAIAHVIALLANELAPESSRHHLREAGLGVFLQKGPQDQGAIVLGQADRIGLGEGEATILDYKSGILSGEDGIAPANLAQLACYRLALQRIYPQLNINAALFSTASGKTIKPSEESLQTALAHALRH